MIVKYNTWSRIHGYLLILQHHIYTQDTPIDFLANHLWRIDGRLSVELISVMTGNILTTSIDQTSSDVIFLFTRKVL